MYHLGKECDDAIILGSESSTDEILAKCDKKIGHKTGKECGSFWMVPIN